MIPDKVKDIIDEILSELHHTPPTRTDFVCVISKMTRYELSYTDFAKGFLEESAGYDKKEFLGVLHNEREIVGYELGAAIARLLVISDEVKSNDSTPTGDALKPGTYKIPERGKYQCKKCGGIVYITKDSVVTPYCGDCKRQLEEDERSHTSQNRINLRTELVSLLNHHSIENGCDTPDYILAEYMMSCLESFEVAVNARTKWYGKGKR